MSSPYFPPNNPGPIVGTDLAQTPDQTTSSRDLSIRLGLNKVPSNVPTYGRDLDRVTFSTAMSNVVAILQHDKAFESVYFSESEPDNDAQCPRVVWKLKSRFAGVNGVNKKNPFWAADEPLEDGRVLVSYIQPQQFEMVWEVYETSNTAADNLRDSIESWLYYHKYELSRAGFESMFFSSELEPTIVSVGNSAKLWRRQIFYTGVINYVYQDIQDRMTSLRIWRVGQDVTFRTTQVIRGASVDIWDSFPVRGPVVLIAIHNDPGTVSVDYEYQTDYVVVVDKEKYGTQFFIRWLNRGKTPTQGNSYYVTYYLPVVDTSNPSQALLTEASTNPALSSLPPEVHPLRVRRSGLRSAVAPHVLGQEVDRTNPTKGQSIIFASERSGISIPGLTSGYLDSLIKADTQVVSVINPASIPGLVPGTAFS